MSIFVKVTKIIIFDADNSFHRIRDSTEADTLLACKSVQMYGDDILYSVESREVMMLNLS